MPDSHTTSYTLHTSTHHKTHRGRKIIAQSPITLTGCPVRQPGEAHIPDGFDFQIAHQVVQRNDRVLAFEVPKVPPGADR